MRIVGIIPSRLESARLPRKAFIDIDGLPMTVFVFKRSQLCPLLDDVYVATDSEEIYAAVIGHGGKAKMTSAGHRTGSDRIAEAPAKMAVDIVVNIQGDEALVNPEHIGEVIRPLIEDEDPQSAVFVTPYLKKNSPSDIKAVHDLDGNILLENIEFNEYLRILEHGYKIKAVAVDDAHISVDTPQDLVEVREQMKSDKIKDKYI